MKVSLSGETKPFLVEETFFRWKWGHIALELAIPNESSTNLGLAIEISPLVGMIFFPRQ